MSVHKSMLFCYITCKLSWYVGENFFLYKRWWVQNVVHHHLAYCQAYWPLSLEFSEGWNECLYARSDDCVTTEPWTPVTTFECPDKCPNRGPHFSGNIADPSKPHQYVACFQGATVGCIACPKGLQFDEKWNACLYNGIYKTQPDY